MSWSAPTIDPQIFLAIYGFLNHEARLLDSARFEEWLDLATEDFTYWIPSQFGQTDAIGVPSIIYDDRRLMTMRIKRLMHPRAYAAMPVLRTQHVIGNIEVTAHDAARRTYDVSSALVVVEHHETPKRIFAGTCRHGLRQEGAGFKMESKRIDLIDCDAVHGEMVAVL
jgi:3-phenylpropionate/cinnamic acid dioxygenase small subunit